MYSNKTSFQYDEIIIPLPINTDLSELLEHAGYDLEGLNVQTVHVVDRGIYKFPVILMGNRIFYSYDIIRKYYDDVAECKSPEEINYKIASYAASRLFTPDDNKKY